MTDAACAPYNISRFDRGPISDSASTRTVCVAFALAVAVSVGAWFLDPHAPIPHNDQAASKVPAFAGALASFDQTRASTAKPAKVSVANADAQTASAAAANAAATADNAVTDAGPSIYAALLDPALDAGFTPTTLAQSFPLSAAFMRSASPEPAQVVADAEAELPLPAPAQSPTVAQMVESVPLPTPRPPELDEAAVPLPVPAPVRAPFRAFPRQYARRETAAPASAAPADNRSFFEKIFGVQDQQPRGPMLAYAAPETNLFRSTPSERSNPTPSSDRYTAVYDISAHTVYMPDGSRLEAHSGLASRLDDPRYVTEKMRGPTPPHLYELTPREALFHGVRALRLTPVGGGTVYGRNGLLAHTFMLGPRGDSNGCVSFRNYNAFLQAYLNGEVKQLAVVASR